MNNEGGAFQPVQSEKPKLFDTSPEAMKDYQKEGSEALKEIFTTVETVVGFAKVNTEIGVGMAAGVVKHEVEEVAKFAKDAVEIGEEIVGAGLAKVTEVVVWAHDTRNRLAEQAFQRTDQYLERVEDGYDKALTKTDKIGWKPLRNLVQQTLLIGKATREVVAEVNGIVPRFVDTQPYGSDVKATVEDVKGIFAGYAMETKQQRIRSENVEKAKSDARIEKHKQAAEDHAARALAFSMSANAIRRI